MFASYLKIALRAMLAQKLYSAINIIGLAVGIACFMMIMFFVQHELSYDAGFANAERIYRVSQEIRPDDGSPDILLAGNAPQVAALLQQEFPQVKHAARLRSWYTSVGTVEGEASYEDVVLADNELFEIFDFQWLAGDAVQALAQPAAAVLTEEVARKYFGDADPLGQTLELAGQLSVIVTGVIQNLPSNTHLRFGVLVSMPLATTAFGANALESWSAQRYHTYVLLSEGTASAELESEFPALIERHLGEGASEVISFSTLPLREIHLHSTRQDDLSPPGSSTVVAAFSAIAAIILLVACINFTNLATARAGQRAQEIGIRKTIGAGRGQVAVQFIGEVLMQVGVAMIVAIALVELLLPAFNVLAGKELAFDILGNGSMLAGVTLLAFLVALLAGGYPAFYLSAFRPVTVFRGESAAAGRGAATFRNALVVLQFASAVALLIATIIIQRQLEFARALDPGYDINGVVVLSASGNEGLGRQWDLMKRELLEHPGVTAVTASNIVPGSGVNVSYFIRAQGMAENRSMPIMLVDYGFFEIYGIDLTAGRSFSQDFGTDQRDADAERTTGTYIINEMAAAQLGWSAEEAIGKSLEVTCCGFGQGLIVGVAKNVHFDALHQPLAPVIYLIPPEPQGAVHAETRLGLRQASLKVDLRNATETLALIDATWARLRPDQPVSRRFLDADIAALYSNEERQRSMLATFSLLAIFITCMGLFGLSTYNTERRRKEIGVRKVMGGSVWSIVLLLTNDFSKLVLISNLIAWPIAYFAMNRWLENFAYRIDLTPLVFIGSGLIALCIAWVTVGGTAAKAASAKPVLALRYE